MLWEIDILPRSGQPDRLAQQVAQAAQELHLAEQLPVRSARGFLLQGELSREQAQEAAKGLLVDPVVEQFQVDQPGQPNLCAPQGELELVVHVLPKPGVMDPVAESTRQALADLGYPVEQVRTLRKFWLPRLDSAVLEQLRRRVLANDAIEQVIAGPLKLDSLELGRPYQFRLVHVPLRGMNDEELMRLSRQGQLFLSLEEMKTIQAYYRRLGRDPTDVELETLAQTWSEHCSHKTLKGRIRYEDEQGVREFENMLRETIFAATQEVRRRLGPEDWCVSVFEDNAGVVQFSPKHHLVFKVETHNHPSALEPYGGANTGLGGVIRDCLGTGLGARPVANTDVFCFAPPDLPPEELPPGVLHPKRVMQGVVAGVRDYGNRMGIPTVNGAVCFDRRYLGNPLVYCGTVGLLPVECSHKEAQPGDLIVTLGGRTGRDGIHGATFSSAELTQQSEELSGGAVQIGNAITEKMLLDVLMEARDRKLYHAITDCGAGGYSSAVGEMGAQLGAEVDLERVPLKYQGLSYTEIWISEAQERMVLAVPEEKWPELQRLCQTEGVEATVIGRFVPTGKLHLRYQGHTVGELEMEFLHHGRPPVVRQAVYRPPEPEPLEVSEYDHWDHGQTLLRILGALNVASKEWIVRQYDHEVQGGSVVKPLVGRLMDGPSDAAVIRPELDSYRGVVISCGINPHYGDLDPYHMAAGAIDEAVRNAVAVGADPRRVALLDNFCWGNTDRPEVLGSLVRAALACHDVALAWNIPFISGKDSLNNEFQYTDSQGRSRQIAIPGTLLISAVGQMEDVRRAVTMDLKCPGNLLYLVGTTREELGGSHYSLVFGLPGGQVPQVDLDTAWEIFLRIHLAIQQGLLVACHDLSEGGLAVAAAEMALAGYWGASLDLARVPHQLSLPQETEHYRRAWADEAPELDLHPLSTHLAANAILLFSESHSRFLCEVPPDRAGAFEELMHDVPCSLVGEVLQEPVLRIGGVPIPQREEEGEPWQLHTPTVVSLPVEQLRQAWKEPLAW